MTLAIAFGSFRLLHCHLTRYLLLQVTFPLVLDTYDFCSNDLKKQLDGPRVAVREEEDRKANKDRAAKKAKMVSMPQHCLAFALSRKIDCIKKEINPSSITACHDCISLSLCSCFSGEYLAIAFAGQSHAAVTGGFYAFGYGGVAGRE